MPVAERFLFDTVKSEVLVKGARQLTLAIMVTLLFAISAAPTEAQVHQIRPGGSYRIDVTITKTPDMELDAGTWEVRAYFFKGLNCFNEGKWTLIAGDYLYDGWWKHRYPAWGAKDSPAWIKPDSRELSIMVPVVRRPRENATSPDTKHTMAELPGPDNMITLRVRLRIKGVDPRVEDNKVSFTIGGARYVEEITKRDGGVVEIREGKIDIVKNYLDVDVDSKVTIRDDAPLAATFSVSMSIPAWWRPLEIPWLLIGGTVAALAVVGVIAIMALRKRRAARALPLPPPRHLASEILPL